MPTASPEDLVRWVDQRQQSAPASAIPFAVFKKYGDDRGASLAALLAYYGFLAIFPALLLLTTVLGYIGNKRLETSVIGSALHEFPVIGTQIGSQAAHPLTGNAVAVVVGALGLAYGALGFAQAGQHAMAQIWNVPGVRRPGFFPRLARSLTVFVVLGIGVAGSTALSGLGTASGRTTVARVLLVIAGLVSNTAIYLALFRTLTPRTIRTHELWRGCVLGGVGWTALLAAGTVLVQRSLRHSQALYGTFAAVLGLLGWIYLAAQLMLYAAELNVVLTRRLWPRSIVQPPLTNADRTVLRDIALQERRRPEQHLLVTFDATDPDSEEASEPEAEGVADS